MTRQAHECAATSATRLAFERLPQIIAKNAPSKLKAKDKRRRRTFDQRLTGPLYAAFDDENDKQTVSATTRKAGPTQFDPETA